MNVIKSLRARNNFIVPLIRGYNKIVSQFNSYFQMSSPKEAVDKFAELVGCKAMPATIQASADHFETSINLTMNDKEKACQMMVDPKIVNVINVKSMLQPYMINDMRLKSVELIFVPNEVLGQHGSPFKNLEGAVRPGDPRWQIRIVSKACACATCKFNNEYVR